MVCFGFYKGILCGLSVADGKWCVCVCVLLAQKAVKNQNWCRRVKEYLDWRGGKQGVTSHIGDCDVG